MQIVTCVYCMQPVRALAGMRSARGALLLHADGSATALQPKPLAAQVAAITQRKHYRAALGVARDELARLPPESAEATAARDMIARTSAKYAAHLLERACEPEAAMQQYLQTIGCAPPLRCAGPAVVALLCCAVTLQTAFCTVRSDSAAITQHNDAVPHWAAEAAYHKIVSRMSRLRRVKKSGAARHRHMHTVL